MATANVVILGSDLPLTVTMEAFDISIFTDIEVIVGSNSYKRSNFPSEIIGDYNVTTGNSQLVMRLGTLLPAGSQGLYFLEIKVFNVENPDGLHITKKELDNLCSIRVVV